MLLRRDSQPSGLSLTAASTLRNLELNGPRRLTDLAADESVTQPAMTQLVSRLERDGLAERTTDPTDGRVVLVRVTPAGTALLRAAARSGPGTWPTCCRRWTRTTSDSSPRHCRRSSASEESPG